MRSSFGQLRAGQSKRINSRSCGKEKPVLFRTVLGREFGLLCNGADQMKAKHSEVSVTRKPDGKWGGRVLFLSKHEKGRHRYIKNGPFHVFLVVSNCEHEPLDNTGRTFRINFRCRTPAEYGWAPLETTAKWDFKSQYNPWIWKKLAGAGLICKNVLFVWIFFFFSISGCQVTIVVTTREYSVPSIDYKAQYLIREMNWRKPHLLKSSQSEKGSWLF